MKTNGRGRSSIYIFFFLCFNCVSIVHDALVYVIVNLNLSDIIVCW